MFCSRFLDERMSLKVAICCRYVRLGHHGVNSVSAHALVVAGFSSDNGGVSMLLLTVADALGLDSTREYATYSNARVS